MCTISGVAFATMNATREPSPVMTRRLVMLHRRHLRAVQAEQAAKDALALAAFEACEREGASRRGIARILGVGSTTVNDWIERGRRLAQSD
jgi:DNA-directed RNA polymerase specialized sigma24 family protein